MEGNWLEEEQLGAFEQDSIPGHLAGFGYRSLYFRIGEIHVSPNDCPECLEYQEFDCSMCEYFAPLACPLRQRQHFITNLRTLFDLHRRREQQRQAAPAARREELIQAVASELHAHGRPLHYAVLSRMMADRYPTLRVTARRVLKAMSSHPAKFERVTAGVYRLVETNEE